MAENSYYVIDVFLYQKQVLILLNRSNVTKLILKQQLLSYLKTFTNDYLSIVKVQEKTSVVATEVMQDFLGKGFTVELF